MKSWGTIEACDSDPKAAEPRSGPPASGLLHLVTAYEFEELRAAVAQGGLPADFQIKLHRLAEGDLIHCFVERNCRLFLALLLAANRGGFGEATPAEQERILRALAYVRKDADAVPDHRLDGYTDDQRAVHAVSTELGGVLQAFKAWRLRHEVPRLWLRPGAG
jgi:hypothetical protein